MFSAFIQLACVMAEAARVGAELEQKRLAAMTHEQRMEYWAMKTAQAAERTAIAAETKPQTINIHTSLF